MELDTFSQNLSRLRLDRNLDQREFANQSFTSVYN